MSQHAQPALPSADAGPGPEDSFAQLAGTLPWIGTWILLLSAAAIINAFLVFAVHGRHGFFLPVLAACVCTLAAIFDGWMQRIPNHLTYTAILVGLGLNAVSPLLEHFNAVTIATWFDSAGLASSLAAFGICAVLGLVGSLFINDCGGGDLKLFVAVGALAGFVNICNISMLALVFGLIYAAANLALFGRLDLVFRVAAQRLLEFFYLRRFVSPIPIQGKPTHSPMGIPLALAIITVLFLQVRYGISGGVV